MSEHTARSRWDWGEPTGRETRVFVIVAFYVSAIGVLDAFYNGRVSLIGLLATGPFIAAAFTRPLLTLIIGLYAALLAGLLASPLHEFTTLNHLLRVGTVLVATGVAVFVSSWRIHVEENIDRARAAEVDERRRRVAAETAEHLQSLAGALTTASAPEQVAEAIFDALRHEIAADAGWFCTLREGTTLRTHRSFGPGPDGASQMHFDLVPDEPLAKAMKSRRGVFIGSSDELSTTWPSMAPALAHREIESLAIVPLIASDRSVGALIVGWQAPRTFDANDTSFLITLAGTAAQSVERARLTIAELDDIARARRLQELSAVLAGAATTKEVGRAIVDHAMRALGAQAGVLRIPVEQGSRLQCLAVGGQPTVMSRELLPVDGTPQGQVFRSGAALVLHQADQVSERFGWLRSRDEDYKDVASVVMEPLAGNHYILGVLAISFGRSHEFTDSERRFLKTMVGLSAQALERAQLLEQEQQARADAETARERLALLGEVTRLLNATLDPAVVLTQLMDLVVGKLADACAVLIPNDTGLVPLMVRGADLILNQATERSDRDPTIPYSSTSAAITAFRTGELQMTVLTPEILSSAQMDPRQNGGFEGFSTALTLPLFARGQILGVMTFMFGPDRGITPDDISLATEVAARTGVALDNASRFQREHQMAEVLQRAVLPQRLPSVPGLRLDAEYRAGTTGMLAGGDWYDVFTLSDGRIFFSVGDVMGKGASAAALMGQVRSAIRAYAISDPSPRLVLAQIDKLFAELHEERIVTAVAGVLDLGEGTVRLANAGHPSPLLRRASGEVEHLGRGNTLLIAAGVTGPERTEQQLRLEVGDSLILFSDGLVERRSESIIDGMDRLIAALSELGQEGWPVHPGSELADRLDEGGLRHDDVVVLCIHRPVESDVSIPRDGALLPGRQRTEAMTHITLAPEVQSTPAARRWVVERLSDLPVEVVDSAVLLVSELVTNAVLHAGTDLVVTIHRMADRIRIDVADANTQEPVVRHYPAEASTGRGLTLFDTLASNWGVEHSVGGKIVWFELLVDHPIESARSSDGRFDFHTLGIAATEYDGRSVDIVHYHLQQIPVTLLAQAGEEYEALFREFRLVKESEPYKSESLPTRLIELIDELGTQFQGFNAGADDEWREVVERHQQSYDWSIDLPRMTGASCAHFDQLLDEADDYCAKAQFITLPADPDSVAVRKWFLGEFVRQSRGEAPQPWPESEFARGVRPLDGSSA